MSNIGQKAPNFSLPGTNGEFNLYTALTQSKVLLIFYPKDNTPG